MTLSASKHCLSRMKRRVERMLIHRYFPSLVAETVVHIVTKLDRLALKLLTSRGSRFRCDEVRGRSIAMPRDLTGNGFLEAFGLRLADS